MERIYILQIRLIVEIGRLSSKSLLQFLKISEHSETNCF